jgi:predicted nucleotidyltransferase
MATSPLETAAVLRQRDEARRQAAAERARIISERLPQARQILESRGATRVWLFGSLAGEAFDIDSDVDLAVESLARADYFDVLAEVRSVLGCPVDLVRIEDALPSLVERIAAEGRLL